MTFLNNRQHNNMPLILFSLFFLSISVFSEIFSEIFQYELSPDKNLARLKLNEQPEKEKLEKIEPPQLNKPEVAPKPSPSVTSQPKEKTQTASHDPRFSKPVVDKLVLQRAFSDDSRDPHRGLAMKIMEHDQVISSKEGKVVTIDNMEGYKNYVIVQHGNGFLTVYGNLSNVNVTEGQSIKKGMVVGTVQKEKCLYFQLNQGEKAVDPMKYIP